MYETTETVLESIDKDHLADRLTGDDGLRTSKPRADGDTGLTQYVWRMAAMHSRLNSSMPVTASWWLQEWLDENGIDASVSGIVDDRGSEITAALDDVVDEILEDHFGYDPNAGAKQWAKAGAF